MESRTLGNAGSHLVIEEFLEGEEASFHVFADGTDFQAMVASQDHKRRSDGDTGPNTGGMGAYSADWILSPSERAAVIETMIRPTLESMETFSGILYAGIMLTPEGPKLLEYNVRFGDPETQVILPRLETDLLDVFLAMRDHRLGDLELTWRPVAAATLVLVSGGYPGKVEKGAEITGLDEARSVADVRVYHAGTRREGRRLYTAGGRVLNVTGTGSNLKEALEKAYFAAEMIDFEGKDYRRDIGQKGLRKEVNETSRRHSHGQ
jgi:phosphoribosylamine--glycine ligase